MGSLQSVARQAADVHESVDFTHRVYNRRHFGAIGARDFNFVAHKSLVSCILLYGSTQLSLMSTVYPLSVSASSSKKKYVENAETYDLARTARLGSFGFLLHGPTGMLVLFCRPDLALNKNLSTPTSGVQCVCF